MTPQELGAFMDALLRHKQTVGRTPRNFFLGEAMMLVFWDMIGTVDGAEVVERRQKLFRGVPVEDYIFQADGVLLSSIASSGT